MSCEEMGGGCVTCKTIASGAPTSPTKRSIVPTPFPPVPSASVIKPASLQDVEWDDSQLEVCSGSGDSTTFSTRRDVNRIGSRWCTRCARACVVLCVRVCVLTKLRPFLRPRGFSGRARLCTRLPRHAAERDVHSTRVREG